MHSLDNAGNQGLASLWGDSEAVPAPELPGMGWGFCCGRVALPPLRPALLSLQQVLILVAVPASLLHANLSLFPGDPS